MWADADAERVEQADDVVGHVAQQIRRRDRLALHRRHERGLDIGDSGVGEPGRLADVAVVEADHVVAATGEGGAEVVVPGDHLRRQAHDENQRRRRRVAEGIEAELDPVRLGASGGRALFGWHSRVSRI